MDVAITEIETHYVHYKDFITGNWKEELGIYKVHGKYNADIIDLLLHALVNATSTSCYVASVNDNKLDMKVEAIHPTRYHVVAQKEIFLSKTGQHYDAIIEAKSPAALSPQPMVLKQFDELSPRDTDMKARQELKQTTVVGRATPVATNKASYFSFQVQSGFLTHDESTGKEGVRESLLPRSEESTPR